MRKRDGIGTGGDGEELFFVCLPAAAATISLIDICKWPKRKEKQQLLEWYLLFWEIFKVNKIEEIFPKSDNMRRLGS